MKMGVNAIIPTMLAEARVVTAFAITKVGFLNRNGGRIGSTARRSRIKYRMKRTVPAPLNAMTCGEIYDASLLTIVVASRMLPIDATISNAPK